MTLRSPLVSSLEDIFCFKVSFQPSHGCDLEDGVLGPSTHCALSVITARFGHKIAAFLPENEGVWVRPPSLLQSVLLPSATILRGQERALFIAVIRASFTLARPQVIIEAQLRLCRRGQNGIGAESISFYGASYFSCLKRFFCAW